MSRRAALLLVATLAAAPAIAGHHRDDGPNDWHAAATDADRDRLRRWRVAFVQALAEANPAHATEITAAGLLLVPDAAQDGPVPPPGAYRCRTVKLGSPKPGAATYLTYPRAPCLVTRDASGALRFSVTGGAQRPGGRLYADGEMRMVFLGTMTLGDETIPLRYGRDAERDLVGSWERIGPATWRLLLPFPPWQSTLDVIEVTPSA